MINYRYYIIYFKQLFLRDKNHQKKQKLLKILKIKIFTYKNLYTLQRVIFLFVCFENQLKKESDKRMKYLLRCRRQKKKIQKKYI